MSAQTPKNLPYKAQQAERQDFLQEIARQLGLFNFSKDRDIHETVRKFRVDLKRLDLFSLVQLHAMAKYGPLGSQPKTTNQWYAEIDLRKFLAEQVAKELKERPRTNMTSPPGSDVFLDKCREMFEYYKLEENNKLNFSSDKVVEDEFDNQVLDLIAEADLKDSDLQNLWDFAKNIEASAKKLKDKNRAGTTGEQQFLERMAMLVKFAAENLRIHPDPIKRKEILNGLADSPRVAADNKKENPHLTAIFEKINSGNAGKKATRTGKKKAQEPFTIKYDAERKESSEASTSEPKKGGPSIEEPKGREGPSI